ncbi:ATM_1a_G0021760.mRNA.1.CDS.1 [Saccharomyces cerevisiae]|nr:ATM_1a_G0021760.mRNA.1.CDS.1 [Saccharomyces cerevisiae]CAI7135073.1 ATM_1a_G0021760.mRNA.1.CDS.1 [Saccharomyces cerevisiae]
MSDGTLFTDLKERKLIRTIVPRGLVRSLKLDVKLADPSDAQQLYEREFPCVSTQLLLDRMTMISLNEVCEVFFPLIGVKPYNATEFKVARENVDTIVSLYEKRLKKQQYLVCDDHETLADLISAAAFSLGFISFFDETWRSKHPEVTRWFNRVIKSRFFEGEFESFKMCETEMQPIK